MLMTWTFTTRAVCGVVTAENVDQALWQLKAKGVWLEKTDLIPAVTHSRWCRILGRTPTNDPV